MKKCSNLFSCILVAGILSPFSNFAQETRHHADELFQKADYFHAFFLYRNLYGNVVSENEFAQRCTQAMTLTRQYADLRATNQYFDAKAKLRELLALNPDDFHYPDLSKMSIEEATYWHKLARKQGSEKENNLMLVKAIALYEEALADGWKGSDISDAIKQCQASKVESEVTEKVASTKTPSEITEKTISTEIKPLKFRATETPNPMQRGFLIVKENK